MTSLNWILKQLLPGLADAQPSSEELEQLRREHAEAKQELREKHEALAQSQAAFDDLQKSHDKLKLDFEAATAGLS